MRKKITTTCIWLPLSVWLIVSVSQGCSKIFEQTTTIYGTITDDKKQLVDSIKVDIYGFKVNGSYYHLMTVYSDSIGRYEAVMEVAGKFNRLEGSISPNSQHTEKYRKYYSGYDTYMEGKKCGNCRIVKGEKNNLDFQLKSK